MVECLLTGCYGDLPSLSQQPRDISYVFSGYAPLSVRLVQLLERPGTGWADFEESTRPIAEPAVCKTQPVARGQEKKSWFPRMLL